MSGILFASVTNFGVIQNFLKEKNKKEEKYHSLYTAAAIIMRLPTGDERRGGPPLAGPTATTLAGLTTGTLWLGLMTAAAATGLATTGALLLLTTAAVTAAVVAGLTPLLYPYPLL